MQKINPCNYQTVTALFEPQAFHTVLRTILTGQTPGQIYVDEGQPPSIGLAQCRHRVFLSGHPDPDAGPELGNLLMGAVAENCRRAGVPLWRLAVGDPAWLPILSEALADHNPIKEDYQVYRYRITEQIDSPASLERFTLEPVNAALLRRDFPGKAALVEEMCSERESVETFLDQSFGIAAFHGNGLAGWCLSEYNFENRCEIGIATHTPFRRRGLARHMTLTFIELARQKGLDTVLWHCEKSNIASSKTALSAGFELVEDQPVLIQYIEPAIHLGVLGINRYKEEDFAEALTLFESALAMASPPGWVAWNGTLAAAHLGDLDRAFDLLDHAIELGFTNLDRLEDTTELAALLEDPRWQQLMDQLKKRN